MKSNSEIIGMLNESFYTKNEFNSLLSKFIYEKNIDGLSIVITKKHERIKKDFQYSYGKEVLNPRVNNKINKADIEINYRIESYKNVTSEIEEEILEIITCYLNIENISRSTKLPSYENQQIDNGGYSKLDFTVKRLLNLKKFVAVFMLDLDNFKNVNDQNEHEIGGGVLFEFGNILLSCCEDNAIVIHRSGDEFFIIMPYNDTNEVLELAYRIKQKTLCYEFENLSQPIELTAAQGICLINNSNLSFDQAAKFAEKAYIPRENAKHRNSVRIHCPYSDEQYTNIDNINLAFSYVRSRLTERCIFFNPYLDFISLMSSQIEKIEDFQSSLDNIIKWLSPEILTGIKFLNLENKINYACKWSVHELAFAIYHGICRNPLLKNESIELKIYQDTVSFSICNGNITIYAHNKKFENKAIASYSIKLPNHEIDDCFVRNTVLIHIGYTPLKIPDCFYRIIRIDARPITGGNLPDFWAGVLSELIDILLNKTDVNKVIVYGDEKNATNMCKVLKDIKNWGKNAYSFSFLSQQTKQSIISIEECKKRLEGNIIFVEENNIERLINEMKNINLNSLITVDQTSICEAGDHRFLERKLSYDSIRLDIEDGCVVDTMEEAFPTILEIIRNYKCNEIMIDQAGRELKEISNFKLTILHPNSVNIPEYYFELKEDLEKYYHSVFGTKDSFFQKHLEENKQYEAVIKHIVDLVENGEIKYATRRALLVIPHIINDVNDVSPLGLVSIYIAPRYVGKNIVFNFSFTWRTVEAIVGLPYSLYGSIRYAEHILEEIKRVVNPPIASSFKMGKVSYMSYSLHMFLDEPYKRIVRGIINDATQ